MYIVSAKLRVTNGSSLAPITVLKVLLLVRFELNYVFDVSWYAHW